MTVYSQQCKPFLWSPSWGWCRTHWWAEPWRHRYDWWRPWHIRRQPLRLWEDEWVAGGTATQLRQMSRTAADWRWDTRLSVEASPPSAALTQLLVQLRHAVAQTMLPKQTGNYRCMQTYRQYGRNNCTIVRCIESHHHALAHTFTKHSTTNQHSASSISAEMQLLSTTLHRIQITWWVSYYT